MPKKRAPRVLSWASILDEGTEQQAIDLATLPIVTPHVAFATQESMALRAEIVFDSLDKFLAGNQINVIL